MKMVTSQKDLMSRLKHCRDRSLFLFVPDNKVPGIKGSDSSGGAPPINSDPGTDFGKKVAELVKSNGDLRKARNSYFE
ncbi:hypothetical protein KHA80_03015 [Anaerobacillus sp. HL2]|nr:hypothetical protein KHA80_03015 [Anaerobacillus sp. HL2]